MMQSYTDRSSYSTDYNGQGGTDRHTGGEYTRNTGYTMGGDTVDFENTRSSYDNVKYRGENRDNLYRN